MEKDSNLIGFDGDVSSDPSMQNPPPAYNQSVGNMGGHNYHPHANNGPPMHANYHQMDIGQSQAYTPMAPQVIIVEQGGGMFSVGPDPIRTKCHSCRTDIETSTSSSCKGSAHICCCLLFWLGCIPCSCIPYCLKSYKRVRHRCPNCKANIGIWSG